FEDARALQSYREGDPRVAASVDLGGARTFFVVPMLKENRLIGTISMWRTEVRAFSAKELALVETFPAQAAIAIENARLLNELRESLQQQTATADVLKVISRSTFDLQVVLNTLVESAAKLCEADMAAIARQQGPSYQNVASYNYSPAFNEHMKHHPIELSRGSLVGRTGLEGRPVHIPYALTDPEYTMIAMQNGGGRRRALRAAAPGPGTPDRAVVLHRAPCARARRQATAACL